VGYGKGISVGLLDSDTGKLKKTVKKTYRAANECEAVGLLIQQVKATHDGFFYHMKFPKVLFVK
jgi:hypothetical protein